LNGTNAVMTETTAFAMAYTWGRGYLQYYKDTPLNIVDNKHLALIMNGALLLDQGYVFKSVDPMSLAEYAKETALTPGIQITGTFLFLNLFVFGISKSYHPSRTPQTSHLLAL